MSEGENEATAKEGNEYLMSVVKRLKSLRKGK